jgi:DNA-binding CsgD family transcriptional regulator
MSLMMQPVLPHHKRRSTSLIYIVDDQANLIASSSLHSEAREWPSLRGTIARLAAECGDGEQRVALANGSWIVRVIRLRNENVLYAALVEKCRIREPLSMARTRFGLSQREFDVLSLLLDGKTAAEIAQTLCIAVSTTVDYVKRLMNKTNARNRADMVAIVLGWKDDRELAR